MLNYVRSFAGVPKQGTKAVQIFTPQFAIIAPHVGAAAKVLWTVHVSTVTLLIRIDDRIVAR
jgi:hypothetical protein